MKNISTLNNFLTNKIIHHFEDDIRSLKYGIMGYTGKRRMLGISTQKRKKIGRAKSRIEKLSEI